MAWEGLRAQAEDLARQRDALAVSHEALEAERQRYRELFELAPDASLVTDLAGTIHEANARATTLLHVPSSLLLGMSLSVFMAADPEAFRALLTRLQAGHAVDHWEVSVRPRGQAPFPAAVSAAPAHASAMDVCPSVEDDDESARQGRDYPYALPQLPALWPQGENGGAAGGVME